MKLGHFNSLVSYAKGSDLYEWIMTSLIYLFIHLFIYSFIYLFWGMKTEDCHEMGCGICSNVIIHPGCGRRKEGFNLCRSFTNIQ